MFIFHVHRCKNCSVLLLILQEVLAHVKELAKDLKCSLIFYITKKKFLSFQFLDNTTSYFSISQRKKTLKPPIPKLFYNILYL